MKYLIQELLHESLILQPIYAIVYELTYCCKLKLTTTVFFVRLLFGRWCEITEERLVSFGHI